MFAWTFLRPGAVAVAIMATAAIDVAAAQGNINQATLTEPDQTTREVSTEDVRRGAEPCAARGCTRPFARDKPSARAIIGA